jgi:hypothetical protein
LKPPYIFGQFSGFALEHSIFRKGFQQADVVVGTLDKKDATVEPFEFLQFFLFGGIIVPNKPKVAANDANISFSFEKLPAKSGKPGIISMGVSRDVQHKYAILRTEYKIFYGFI